MILCSLRLTGDLHLQSTNHLAGVPPGYPALGDGDVDGADGEDDPQQNCKCNGISIEIEYKYVTKQDKNKESNDKE